MSAMTRRDQRTSLFPDLMDMLEAEFRATDANCPATPPAPADADAEQQ